MWETLQKSPPFVFVEQHETLFAWLAFASLMMVVASVILVPMLLIWMPTDYFQREREEERADRTLLGWTVMIAKNLAGAILLLAGIAMLLLPGQGIISILAGLSLMNFPGKRKLERKIIGRPKVLASINWLREKAGRAALRIDPDGRAR